MIVASIPAELRARQQWVPWRREWRKGKWTKVPYDAHTSCCASSTDPDTWSSFDHVLEVLRRGGYDGAGYVFAAEDPYTGVDLDHCRDPESGRIESWAVAILDRLKSWSHWSPSGEGAHIFVKASLPGAGRKTAYQTGAIEMYDRGRFFTITSRRVEGTPTIIEDRQDALLALYAEVYPPKVTPGGAARAANVPNDLDDQRLLELAFGAQNGQRIAALWQGDVTGYGSASEADLALCNHLAFWTGRDSARIDRLFRLSALWRSKWDERRGELTYGQRTIDAAIAGTNGCFGDDAPRRLDPLRRPRAVTIDISSRPAAVPIDVLARPFAVPLEVVT